jgi:hypothetical protein
MRTSDSLIRTTAGFAFAPRPNVMYPVRPVNAPMAVVEVVIGKGVDISVADIVGIENMA